MANESVLTKPTMTLAGLEPPATNWYDCGPLECLTFDDQGVTQAHIDLAAERMASANGSDFLRWLSLDRGFVGGSRLISSLSESPSPSESERNGSV